MGGVSGRLADTSIKGKSGGGRGDKDRLADWSDDEGASNGVGWRTMSSNDA